MTNSLQLQWLWTYHILLEKYTMRKIKENLIELKKSKKKRNENFWELKWRKKNHLTSEELFQNNINEWAELETWVHIIIVFKYKNKTLHVYVLIYNIYFHKNCIIILFFVWHSELLICLQLKLNFLHFLNGKYVYTNV